MSLNLQKTENTGSSICGILYIIKGTIFSFILSLLLIIPAAIILKTFFPTDEAVFASSMIISFISAFFCGFYMSRHVLKSGLLNGALAGILYFLILFLSGSIASGGINFSLSSILAFAVSLLGGAIGGIFGINSVKSQRRR